MPRSWSTTTKIRHYSTALGLVVQKRPLFTHTTLLSYASILLYIPLWPIFFFLFLLSSFYLSIIIFFKVLHSYISTFQYFQYLNISAFYVSTFLYLHLSISFTFRIKTSGWKWIICLGLKLKVFVLIHVLKYNVWQFSIMFHLCFNYFFLINNVDLMPKHVYILETQCISEREWNRNLSEKVVS